MPAPRINFCPRLMSLVESEDVASFFILALEGVSVNPGNEQKWTKMLHAWSFGSRRRAKTAQNVSSIDRGAFCGTINAQNVFSNDRGGSWRRKQGSKRVIRGPYAGGPGPTIPGPSRSSKITSTPIYSAIVKEMAAVLPAGSTTVRMCLPGGGASRSSWMKRVSPT